MRILAWGASLGLVLLAACNGGGGGGGADPANATVTGSAADVDFSFTPAQAGALFQATGPGVGELTVFLCETGCAALGGGGSSGSESRSVILTVEATTAELRSGGVFPVGSGAEARAEVDRVGGPLVDEAVGGEVVIESSDLSEGGMTVGTFQLETASGGSLGGFFEAPIAELSGQLLPFEGLCARETGP